jgi:hypothetical protein
MIGPRSMEEKKVVSCLKITKTHIKINLGILDDSLEKP